MLHDPKISRFAEGFVFPEGPVFDDQGNLYVVNLKGGHISKVTPQAVVTTLVKTGGAPNGATIRSDGNLVIADSELKAILEISPNGDIQTLVENYDGKEFQGPNDLAFDQRGNLYFTDPEGSSLEERTGTVYCLTPRGEIVQVMGGLAYPNGVAVSADSSMIFVAETFTGNIWRISVSSNGEPIGTPETWAALGEGIWPDGIALSVDGHLFAACYKRGAVAVIKPNGQLLMYISAGGAHPTNLAFGGIDSKQLYVTETDTNAVYVLDVGIEGQRLFG